MTLDETRSTVLVVDDDAGIRAALVDILTDEGYVVDSAPDGQAALELLWEQTNRPALVLLDLMMPRMNGWQLRAEQRRDPMLADIPVVVISAGANVREQLEALDVVDYLPKPIAYDRLVDLVARYCQNRHTVDGLASCPSGAKRLLPSLL